MRVMIISHGVIDRDCNDATTWSILFLFRKVFHLIGHTLLLIKICNLNDDVKISNWFMDF